MNHRAQRIIEQQTHKLGDAASGLRSILDNPDDFELGHDAELELRNAAGLIEAMRAELLKLAS